MEILNSAILSLSLCVCVIWKLQIIVEMRTAFVFIIWNLPRKCYTEENHWEKKIFLLKLILKYKFETIYDQWNPVNWNFRLGNKTRNESSVCENNLYSIVSSMWNLKIITFICTQNITEVILRQYPFKILCIIIVFWTVLRYKDQYLTMPSLKDSPAKQKIYT